MTETLDTRCIACGLALTPDETHSEAVCRLIRAARDLMSEAPPAWAWDALAEAVARLELGEGEVVFADPARAGG